MTVNHPDQTTAHFANLFYPWSCEISLFNQLFYCPPVKIKNTIDRVNSASEENAAFQPKLSFSGRVSLKFDIINTTVAKGEVVIDNAHPAEIDRAARVGSTGNIGRAPKILPKNTAIIIGLTPR